MGFPSPAADYVSKTPDLNDICGITPGDTVFMKTDNGYVLLSTAHRPVQGDMVLIQFCGSTQFAIIRGPAFITEDGEAIEGEALEEVVVIVNVTPTIISTRGDERPVI